MSETSLYSTERLCKDYGVGQVLVHALRDVCLKIAQGEFIVVLGPSGSGKSTLLNLLGGMDSASSGSIRFRGTEISRFSEEQLTDYRRTHVGFVFQLFNLIPTLTARENVEIAMQIAGKRGPALQMLELVGLGDRAEHFPSQLSGGEQQRVAIARAVAKEPVVLLCDEPTGALDYETGKTVLSVLRRVHRQRGTTVVVVTHNAAIGVMADRVVKMRSGTVQEIVTNERPAEAEDLRW